MRADARRNRAAIITAARDAFDSGENPRFDDFAVRAGVGVGTLYRNFPDREALAAAVYQDEVEALCARAHECTRPAGEALAGFLRDFVDYVVDHAALARALATLVDAETQSDGGTALERTVAELMERAAAEGATRKDVPAGAVMAVLHGIGSCAGRPRWADESRVVVDLLIRGLRADTSHH